MSDDEKTLPDNLQVIKTRCQDILTELHARLANGVKAKATLDAVGHGGGLARWLGDHVFRPGNPERLQNALTAMANYNGSLEACINKAYQIIEDLADLSNVQSSMTEWKSDITKLIPLIVLRITFPDQNWNTVFDAHSFDTKAFDWVLAGEGIMALVTLPFGGFAAFSAMAAITLVIGGIVAGEKDKKLYDDMDQKAEAAFNEVNAKLKNPLDGVIASVNSFWADAGKAVVAAGYVKPGTVTPISTTDALHKVAFRVAKFAAAVKTFNALMTAYHNEELDSNATTAAGVLADKPTQADINEFKLYYYYDQKNMNIPEIAKILNISEKKAQGLQARELLDEGKTPEEIAKILSMPTKTITEIKKILDLRKGG